MRNFNFCVVVVAHGTKCCTFYIVDAGCSGMMSSSILMTLVDTSHLPILYLPPALVVLSISAWKTKIIVSGWWWPRNANGSDCWLSEYETNQCEIHQRYNKSIKFYINLKLHNSCTSTSCTFPDWGGVGVGTFCSRRRVSATHAEET